mmetsp:Transcript_37993/g.90257  ORF Transcript_37993/g.90257 Transcript_37993/m.90257 type:complete len:111 (+) Transcript_37993:531-863(+)
MAAATADSGGLAARFSRRREGGVWPLAPLQVRSVGFGGNARKGVCVVGAMTAAVLQGVLPGRGTRPEDPAPAELPHKTLDAPFVNELQRLCQGSFKEAVQAEIIVLTNDG